MRSSVTLEEAYPCICLQIWPTSVKPYLHLHLFRKQAVFARFWQALALTGAAQESLTLAATQLPFFKVFATGQMHLVFPEASNEFLHWHFPEMHWENAIFAQACGLNGPSQLLPSLAWTQLFLFGLRVFPDPQTGVGRIHWVLSEFATFPPVHLHLRFWHTAFRPLQARLFTPVQSSPIFAGTQPFLWLFRIFPAGQIQPWFGVSVTAPAKQLHLLEAHVTKVSFSQANPLCGDVQSDPTLPFLHWLFCKKYPARQAHFPDIHLELETLHPPLLMQLQLASGVERVHAGV